MKTGLTLLSAWLLAAGAFGQGSQVIIRERAKELRDQNNVRQGVPPPTQPPGGPTAPSAGAPPQAQSPALLKLNADLSAITASSQVSVPQKQKIAQDVIAVAQAAKPSADTAARFSEEVCGALAEKPLSATSLARFVQELDAILNPTKYPQAKPDGIFTDVQAIFQENGSKRTKAVAISDSVKALAAEVRVGGR
jgi:hypothetical protein